ncbi:MAG: hypothetical protein WC655_25415, partial [Candidatus Hydrogenedentales bacterium]
MISNVQFIGMALVATVAYACFAQAEMLCDHEAVLDANGKLQPWTTYDNVLKGSMAFIQHCPTKKTNLGDDPWYLISSEFNEDGSFRPNQNNQGSNAYWAVETVARYYTYTGDRSSLDCARLLLDRILQFHTPPDWNWANVPRTQDNSPDGEYTDAESEPDKMAMVGYAYVRFFRITGDQKYLEAAVAIAKALFAHMQPGDDKHSPLPFRVDLQTGKVLDQYTANMIAPVLFFDILVDSGLSEYAAPRDTLWKWILEHPMTNNLWSGYYEDVGQRTENLNQQIPMEIARYMLHHPEVAPDYKTQVPALLTWVRGRFGATKRYGATSVREQDVCFEEMSSHTARYASVAALWFGVTGDAADREEARAAFALSTYSTFNKHTKDGQALNYVGLGYPIPWFSDSYFDFLAHFMDGMSAMPELAPADADHLIGTSATVKTITYAAGRIEYDTFEPEGSEI